MVEGFDRAARDFDFEPVVLQAPFTDLDEQLAAVAESGADLVLFWRRRLLRERPEAAARQYPDTTWAYLGDARLTVPVVTFAVHEAAFLAGAAAALTTKTGIVGYVGGFQYDDDRAVPRGLRGRGARDRSVHRDPRRVHLTRRDRASSATTSRTRRRPACTSAAPTS